MDDGQGRSGLARFACDFCKHKKIKCSRELPKCAACKPWPGICDYSRRPVSLGAPKPEIMPLPQPETVPISLGLPVHAVQRIEANSAAARLEKVEAALESLTASVNRLLAASDPQDTRGREKECSRVDSIKSIALGSPQTGRAKSPISPHSFSAVGEADSQLGRILPLLKPQPDYNIAVNGLQDLTKDLKNPPCPPLSTVNSNFTRAYIVPDRETGLWMMHNFSRIMRLTKVYFDTPSDELLQQVIFKPTEAPPAWVIFVSYLLLAAPDSTDPGTLTNLLRWNTKLALNHASMYLVPCNINVQALMLLSFHGEDYASPNTSWILTSHACHQAEAVALYSPSTELNREAQQRQLSLFWGLFVLEKTCALAFGRPVFMPTAFYRNVPVPSFDHLAKFNFHLHNSSFESSETTYSPFGAHLFLQNIKLAKLIGTILDVLASGGSLEERDRLRAKLDAWCQETTEILGSAQATERKLFGEKPNGEMSQLVATIKLRATHAMIILVKGLPQYDELRLSGSRQILQLLPQMVAGWHPFYNGVIWQILYYPFTPFFVLLSHVLRNPRGPDVHDDLALLQSLTGHFTNLRSRLTLLSDTSARLAHTAEVFFRLAQRYVQESNAAPFSGFPLANPECPSTPSAPKGKVSTRNLHPESVSGRLVSNPALEDFTFNDVEIDKFMSWLPQDLPADFSSFGSTGSHSEDNAGSTSTARQNAPHGQKRPFEATFDWFSWEQYYSDSGAPSGGSVQF
ncbi:hypothetical protein B0H63DRAFT_174318 [Podospora didyma]|uniref:Zn(2)-C6 fungal-type domain-containing protein n=1 Tax=Podospora didyma TaxID=330526 RepID=A0AAE0NNT2_9PEZI|nr:hypothetical protein B0H63DRAFT_174318 [Podospora didyma]